jgi:hypothetical protein
MCSVRWCNRPIAGARERCHDRIEQCSEFLSSLSHSSSLGAKARHNGQIFLLAAKRIATKAIRKLVQCSMLFPSALHKQKRLAHPRMDRFRWTLMPS